MKAELHVQPSTLNKLTFQAVLALRKQKRITFFND